MKLSQSLQKQVIFLKTKQGRHFSYLLISGPYFAMKSNQKPSNYESFKKNWEKVWSFAKLGGRGSQGVVKKSYCFFDKVFLSETIQNQSRTPTTCFTLGSKKIGKKYGLLPNRCKTVMLPTHGAKLLRCKTVIGSVRGPERPFRCFDVCAETPFLNVYRQKSPLQLIVQGHLCPNPTLLQSIPHICPFLYVNAF